MAQPVAMLESLRTGSGWSRWAFAHDTKCAAALVAATSRRWVSFPATNQSAGVSPSRSALGSTPTAPSSGTRSYPNGVVYQRETGPSESGGDPIGVEAYHYVVLVRAVKV